MKHYLDINVLDAAIQRIHHVYDTHDTVAVAFSGGKDSLVTLQLTLQVARERGRLPLNVIFRDEELIPDQVLDFVNEYRQHPDLRMDWWAVQLKSQRYILGTSHSLTLWDKNRKWLRQKPDWAITQAPGIDPDNPADQYSMDAIAAERMQGRVAVMTGIRADESLIRLRSCVNKLNDNYINATSSKRAFLCKPIFDWSESDVFKFFMERGIRYCPLYDAQHLGGMGLRVSTPFHAERAKRLSKLRTTSPVFYSQIMDLFPEMLVQERYYAEYDQAGQADKYASSREGIEAWIEANVEEGKPRETAMKRLASVMTRHASSPKAYPLAAILRYFQSGSFKREMLPLQRSQQ